MNSVFSEQILADKLSKLNGTQQCIETLSHWCIFHRTKAEQVVSTWDKQFRASEIAQKVPLLYLANDILQNSKRKGNEFVSEFWKVLPSALKDVALKGDDRGKNAVSRLVNIWDERRVFGSRARSLNDVMLGEEAPPPLEFGKKRSRSVKIMKRDSRSIRTKLTIGGTAEKIVSAFHRVISEHSTEEAEMSNCKTSVNRVRKMEEDVDIACNSGKENPKRKTFSKELEDQENSLRQCIEKLKSVESSRVALVSELKEALHEQESELENVRTQMQVAQAQADEASNMRKRLNGEDYKARASTSTSSSVDANAKPRQGTKRTAAAIAAEVADKLAASTSSQLIMHSVLSTFAAQEAKGAGLTKVSAQSNSFTSMPMSSVDSLSKPPSDQEVFVETQSLPAPSKHSYQSVLLPPQNMQQSQVPSTQNQFHMLPNPPSQQYMQPSGGMMTPYGYGSISPLPPGPPPPPPPYMVSPMVPLTPQTPQINHQQPMQMTQQQQPMGLTQQAPGPPSFRPLQPPGMVYYGHPPHS
ncbi:Regulation of nuclear pre-mRNA domain-containing protein 1A [Euphorbia peplus]|nr:Regulation of nuclear pre-mRNA domain-containing protein 1A [Euphorbia peplus]